MIRSLLTMLAVAALAGCSLPRGGGVQSEILSTRSGAEEPQFAVHMVTRDFLPIVAGWPASRAGQESDGWIGYSAPPADRAIQPYDILDIVVWDSEETSLITTEAQKMVDMADMQVSAGGTIFLPFVSMVQVAGLSRTQARARIQRKMEEIVPSAQVQLNVKPGARGSVSVVAGVSSPGAYPLSDTHYTVLNAIAAAGGASASIENPQVRLIRAGKSYATSLERLYRDPSLDTILHGGDKLLVEADPRYFRSLGAAQRETIVAFPQDVVTALDALSLIGGLAETRADPKGILILREYPENVVRDGMSGPAHARSVFVVDLTSADGLFSAGQFRIEPEDTVMVSESPISGATTILGLVARVLDIANDADSIDF
ncbi:polysaccharide biosynthesis/export family protein [Aliiroseovarius sp.]|uniref:polysaccharide biosynthesis/export family protein n=1 Tax=Aliiroseovarius sp. TaxID=1872442 RepID=UPI00262E3BAE|nr:polysaccharide biosynthesis/export family protein [Aliiroseovarius sp.]